MSTNALRQATKETKQLGLGADLVRELLPHRPPFLFVDAVETFSSAGEMPFLTAAHAVSANEPVFGGHFPDLYLWPGVYTIEGLAQCCLLQRMLMELEAGWATKRPVEEFAPALRAWQQSVTTPGRPTGDPRVKNLIRFFDEEAQGRRGRTGGMLVAADVKLTHPVFAGQRLEYRVERRHVVGPMFRFGVEASVAGRGVAKGNLTVAMVGGFAEAGGPV
jgi:3-hydroxyacyl-[acyl-carrier-protein] dehydratase